MFKAKMLAVNIRTFVFIFPKCLKA